MKTSIKFDLKKNQRNRETHGFSFEDVCRFDFNTAWTRDDKRRDYGETRRISVGMLDERLMVLVWTPRDGAMRIISLRRANERERKHYEKAKKITQSH